MKTILLYLLFPLVAMLSACHNPTPTGQTTPTPVRPDPTSTPTSTLVDPTPTSVVSDLVATSVYTHSTGRFSINYPEHWQFSERTDGVVFVEPGDQAGYSVFFNDAGQVYSEKELKQYLVTFVAENFAGKDSGFAVISPEKLVGNTIEAQFATRDPKLGQMMNEIRVSQVDTLVFVQYVSATEEQWQISQNRLQALANSLTPLDTAPATATSPTEEPPVWILIGPTSNRFGFFYPNNWEILQQEKNTVVVGQPDASMTFEASTFVWPKAGNDSQVAEEAARAYLTNITQKYKDVKNLPLAKFPLDTIPTGATIDFLYTTENREAMAGSVIAAAKEGQVYRIVFTAPAATYRVALEWFNPMHQSFKILSPEEFLKEP
ncbi:MAG: hypothetical protein JXM69_20255 [Anaerolineae bacterium]|nr:hypothetical protein [Anaerolineae bacterium]